MKKLRESGFIVDEKPTITKEELVKVVGGYDALVVRSRTEVTAEIINASKKLRVVARAGVGVDNIDVKAAEDKGVLVINTPEAPSVAVAELTLGFMLSLVREISRADRTMKRGEWIKNQLTGRELRGKTLGVVGFGRIGYQVAKRASAFEMKVLAYDVAIDRVMRYIKELGAEPVTLQELLRRSDFVTIHVPLLPETRHLIGEKEIEMMKNGGYLLNTSRGGIVDEEALEKALKSGKLAGAGLDVFESEPPKDTSLSSLENLVATPHIGAQTEEAQREAAIILSDKLAEAFKARS
jgi:D-3-phosphoglycerate dehydrogenase